MKHPFLEAACCSCLVLQLLCGFATALAQDEGDAIVLRLTPVWLKPEADREPLATLKPGTIVRAISRQGDWRKIIFRDLRFGERTGYVLAGQIRVGSGKTAKNVTSEPIPPAAPAPKPAPSVAGKTPSPVPPRPAPPAATSAARVELWPVLMNEPKVMVYGGARREEYLGCLNCPETDVDSIFNARGKYGQCDSAAADNLFCRGASKKFGSNATSQNLSACSPAASEPPAIVDEAGRYLGRFSVGGAQPHADSLCAPQGRFATTAGCELVEWICSR